MNFEELTESHNSLKLLKCRKCSNVTTGPPEQHPSFRHCFTCICSNPDCNEFWYICSQHSCRFASTKYGKMRNHFIGIDHEKSDLGITTIAHTAPIQKETSHEVHEDAFMDSSDIYIDSLNDSSGEESILCSENKRLKRTHTLTDDDAYLFTESLLIAKTKRFFDEDGFDAGSGIRGIVGRAFRQDSDSEIVATLKESNLHLNITHFCSTLSQSQQDEFSSIIACLVQKDTFSITRPPMSYADINKFYMSSQHSIYQNIPSPDIFVIDNHACVSIENIINLMLSFGTKLNSLNLSTKFSQLNCRTDAIENTREVENIIDNINSEIAPDIESDPIIIYVILWSDDFEANHTRKNRNSTWVKTITICPPSSFSTSPIYTHPIAIGRKGQCHDNVNNFFNQELRRISKCTLRYSKQYRKLHPVFVRPLCVSADRPERSTLNCILSHNGCSTKRWMYSELIPRNKLPSCKSCFNARWKDLDPNKPKKNNHSICRRCCDWEMNANDTTCHFLPPTNYPTEKHRESPPAPCGRDVSKPFEKLPPIRITYQVLSSATKFAFWNYLHGVWNKSQTQIYFRLVGISTSYFNTIIEKADNQKNIYTFQNKYLRQYHFLQCGVVFFDWTKALIPLCIYYFRV